MIFLTVGTQFPFDRLVKAVDAAAETGRICDEIYAQIGDSAYRPRNFEYMKFLEKRSFDDCVRKASHIISHAGIGTITMAMDNNKPILVMPRLKRYGEVVNDHQVAIARRFEQMGYIFAVYDTDRFQQKIAEFLSFVPRPRGNNAEAVIDRINKFLSEISI